MARYEDPWVKATRLEVEVERLEAKIEAALAKIKEMREWGNDGEYGEGYYDAVDEIERALTGRE